MSRVNGDLTADALVLADGLAPLHALGGPVFELANEHLQCADTRCRQAEAPRVQRGQGNLKPLTGLANDVLGGHLHILEGQRAVGNAAQAHELAAAHTLDAGGIRLDNEG